MLLLYYPPFRATDEAELLALTVIGLDAYVEELSRFDEDTLAKAWREVRARHRTQGWPVIGVIVDACNQGGRKSPYQSGMDKRESEREASDALLNDILYNGTLGYEAAQQGWCYELKIFLTRNLRTPNQTETEHLRTAYDRCKIVIADMERREAAGEELIGMKSLRGIFEHMPIREANLAETILKQALMVDGIE